MPRHSDMLDLVLRTPASAPLPESDAQAFATVQELLGVMRDRAAAIDALASYNEPKKRSDAKRCADGIRSVAEKLESAQAAGTPMPGEYVETVLELMQGTETFTPAAIAAARDGLLSGSPISAALLESIRDVVSEAHVECVTAVMEYGARLRWEPRFRLHANLLNLDGNMPKATIDAVFQSEKFLLVQETAVVFSEAHARYRKEQPEANRRDEWYILINDPKPLPVDLEAIAPQALNSWRTERAKRSR